MPIIGNRPIYNAYLHFFLKTKFLGDTVSLNAVESKN